MGSGRAVAPVEPWKPAVPKEKMPPSDATSQYPLPPGAALTAKTVPVSWAMEGEELDDKVAVTQAGGPAANVSGVTAAQAEPFHHCRVAPPPRLQSVTVNVAKLLPAATSTSKNEPVEDNGGAPTGLALY